MLSGLFVVLALSVFTTAPCLAAKPQATSPSVEEAVRHSSFVFAGTVKKLNATTISIVPAKRSTAVVRVDEILHNPGVVSDLTGKDITVQFQEPTTVKEGEVYVFFTNVGLYGESIAVNEVGHLEAKQQVAAIRAQVNESVARLPDERLQKRIAQADLVVAGTVTSTRPVAEPERRFPPFEHAPDWWESVVRVQAVEKGQPPQGDLVVLFPHSTDFRWFASPKLKEGQQGIFLLHLIDEKELGVRGYTALDPFDVQPLEQREHVKKLMR